MDRLFVLTGDGRRWFLPASVVAGGPSIRLGGELYSEFEVKPSAPLEAAVYGHPDEVKMSL